MNWFGADTLAFLSDLAAHNDRQWFAANRETYMAAVRDPARNFADALARGMAAAPGVPHTGKIYRINRDLRFSKDRTPYNTHVHIAVWPRDTGAQGPTWMVGLEPGRLTLGAGIMGFSPTQLRAWRTAVAGRDGGELQGILRGLVDRGVRLSQPELKRVPAPYEDGHVLADLLCRKSLTVWRDVEPPSTCFGEAGPGNCADGLAAFASVVAWLRRHVAGC